MFPSKLGVLLLLTATTTVNAAVIEVGNFDNPNTIIDFDNFAAGPITVSDINTANPGAGINSISLTCTGGTGSYGFNVSGGRGIACDRDGSGLENYDVSTTFFEMTSITVALDHFATELGFQHGDRTGVQSAFSFFSNGSLVETFSPGTSLQDNLLLLRSDTAFNSFTFSEPINWVVNELRIQTSSSDIPEPSLIALFGLGFAGMGYHRRRKQNKAA